MDTVDWIAGNPVDIQSCSSIAGKPRKRTPHVLHSTGTRVHRDDSAISPTSITFQIVNERIYHCLSGTRKNAKGIRRVIDYIGVVYREAARIEHRDTVPAAMSPA